MPESGQLSTNNLLFVYGTLIQNAGNPFAYHLRQHSQFVGRAHFAGRLYRIDWYPGAIADQAATTQVHGDVFHLHQPDSTLALLDEYEDTAGESGEFVRAIVPVTILGQKTDCWVYLYNYPTANLVQIESGDFRSYI